MTPQNPPQAPAAPAPRGNTTQAPASPARPPTRCTAPGCDRPVRSKGLCKRHYQAAWAGKQTLAAYVGTPLAIFPRHPRAVRDALHALAERAATEPGWTNERYRAAQDRIKEGGTP